MMVDRDWRECADALGPGLRAVLLEAHKSCTKDNDHYPLLILGPTNSGKSNLGLWVYETIHPSPLIWRVVWTKDEFAQAQARVAREEKPRFLMYDELDAESKEAMSSWNKHFKRLFDKVRYSNIFWVLVNPSANYIDKSLILDEVVKGVLVIRDKLKTRPREVVLYTVDDLIRMVNADLPLTLTNLRSRKVMRKYGFLLSWFRPYDGVLKEEYERKKASRTVDIHELFAQEHGEDGRSMTFGEAARRAGVSRTTFMKDYRACVAEGSIQEELTPTGRGKVSPEAFSTVLQRTMDRHARISRVSAIEYIKSREGGSS